MRHTVYTGARLNQYAVVGESLFFTRDILENGVNTQGLWSVLLAGGEPTSVPIEALLGADSVYMAIAEGMGGLIVVADSSLKATPTETMSSVVFVPCCGGVPRVATPNLQLATGDLRVDGTHAFITDVQHVLDAGPLSQATYVDLSTGSARALYDGAGATEPVDAEGGKLYAATTSGIVSIDPLKCTAERLIARPRGTDITGLAVDDAGVIYWAETYFGYSVDSRLFAKRKVGTGYAQSARVPGDVRWMTSDAKSLLDGGSDDAVGRHDARRPNDSARAHAEARALRVDERATEPNYGPSVTKYAK